MRSTRFLNILCLLLIAATRRGAAQGDQRAVYSASWTVGWNAPVANGSNIGHDRTLMMAGLERRFVLATGRLGTVSFAPALLPAVDATNNRHLAARVCPRNGSVAPAGVLKIGGQCYDVARYSAFGIGVLPVAFRWQTSNERRIGLIANLDGGGIWFNHRLPVSEETHLNGTLFNFTARAGVDAVLRVTHRTWISAGYRHLHLSNGGFGDINPGIDAPLVALGLSWR